MSPQDNPAEQYLTQTDERGIVTGMPAPDLNTVTIDLTSLSVVTNQRLPNLGPVTANSDPSSTVSQADIESSTVLLVSGGLVSFQTLFLRPWAPKCRRPNRDTDI